MQLTELNCTNMGNNLSPSQTNHSVMPSKQRSEAQLEATSCSPMLATPPQAVEPRCSRRMQKRAYQEMSVVQPMALNLSYPFQNTSDGRQTKRIVSLDMTAAVLRALGPSAGTQPTGRGRPALSQQSRQAATASGEQIISLQAFSKLVCKAGSLNGRDVMLMPAEAYRPALTDAVRTLVQSTCDRRSSDGK